MATDGSKPDGTGTNGDVEAPARPEDQPGVLRRAWRIAVGPPRDLKDRALFHQLALIPVLAWIGLGADGLSSSAYGPEEAYRTLGSHTYLALGLAVATAITVMIISMAYSKVIEEFPHGGGGYLVASKLLGERVGLVSGHALIVDYVLTITVSISSACDAIFSFMPLEWQVFKLPAAAIVIGGLTVLNIRGVRESILVLSPIFALFILTHAIVIFGGIGLSLDRVPEVSRHIEDGFRLGLRDFGAFGLFMMFAHAYSMGAGTYTGIEAVSNGLPIIREPRVRNAKRTMLYMAVSLSIAAGGLIVCYLLRDVGFEPGKTLNAVLLDRLATVLPVGGTWFTVLTLFTEGALLIVAAQAGFLGGPRVLANMAVDSWVPRRFALLSERLTSQNGYVLMGAASLAALFYTRGDVRKLVIMYSINVFVTFSLSMFGMLRLWIGARGRSGRGRSLSLFTIGLVLCLTILVITVYEKFSEGGWVTLLVTGALIVVSFMVRRHYRNVGEKLAQLDTILGQIPGSGPPNTAEPDPGQPTAVVFVGQYGGLGIHTILNIFKSFPGYFRNFVFVSVGVVDSGAFKGEDEMEHLRTRTLGELKKYEDFVRRLGFPATSRWSIGTDTADEAEAMAHAINAEFPRVVFFAGKVIFQRERWYSRFLHNQMAFAVQKRLQWLGIAMVIMPVRVS